MCLSFYENVIMNPQVKEATPKRIKLAKNFKLPNEMKTMIFMRAGKAEQRSEMLAYSVGEDRKRQMSKRDLETYAENPQNVKIGRKVATA